MGQKKRELARQTLSTAMQVGEERYGSRWRSNSGSSSASSSRSGSNPNEHSMGEYQSRGTSHLHGSGFHHHFIIIRLPLIFILFTDY